MPLNKLDRYFHRHLHDHPSELDTEALWQTVAPPPASPHSYAPWVWSLLLFLFALSYSQQVAEEPRVAETAPERIPAIVQTDAPSVVQNTNLVHAAEPRTVLTTARTQSQTSPSTRIKEKQVARLARRSFTAPVSLQLRLPLAELVPPAIEITAPSSPLPSAPVMASAADTIPRPDTIYLGSELGLRTDLGQNRWYVSAQIGAFRPFRQLELDNERLVGHPLNEWVAERQVVETILGGWAVDVAAGHQTRSGWYYKAGLGVSKIHERFDYTEPSDSDPDIRVDRQSHNSITLIDFPISIGHTFGQNRLRPFVELGARFNIRQRVSGTRLDPDGFPYILNDRLHFKRQVSHSTQIGLGASWQWRPQIDLFAKAQFRHYPDSYTRAFVAVRERYQWLGVQLGIRSYFSRTEE